MMLSFPASIKMTPGGATQNTIRVAQWVLMSPNISTFLGSVGNDANGKFMKNALEAEGVKAAYVVDPLLETGKCAVLLTCNGLKRTLVSFHGAARSFQKRHISQKWSFVEKGRLFYCAGFTIAANFEPLTELAEHALVTRRVFCFNLAAIYICTIHVEKVKQLLPLVDILFGNRSEFEALSAALELPAQEIKDICMKLAEYPSEKKRRLVIMTDAENAIMTADSGERCVGEFDVPPIDQNEKKDTNGAGDAFVGGFLGQFILSCDGDMGQLRAGNNNLENCIRTGIYCASRIIRISGVDLKLLGSFDENNIL